MPALFPRRANAVMRSALVAVAAVAIAVPLALMGWVRTPIARGEHVAVAQPVPFDHRIHVTGLHIDCRYCHSTVERAASAGMPSTAACVSCHNHTWLASRAFAPVRASLAAHRPIPWRRVYQVPDFVYFDHAIHVEKGVACESCHGRVDEMARVEQVRSLTMGWCLDCHRNPDAHLRPLAEVTAMGWRPPAGVSRDALGRVLAARYDVHPPTNCTACHR